MKKQTAKAKRDIYQEVTNQIIAELEKGTAPWSSPFWSEVSQPIRSTGEAYKGVNVFILSMAAMRGGWESNEYYTYQQAKALGGQVRKGEKGTTIIFFKPLKKELKNGDVETIPLMRSYTVFNLEQIDDLEAQHKSPVRKVDNKEIKRVENYFNKTKAKIIKDVQTTPCYVPAKDEIRMPPLSQFVSSEAYYATLAHETIHWTMAEHRCNRKSNHMIKAEYAFEELVAETGAALLSAHLGLANEVRDDHATYIQSWLHALRNDKKYFFQAAAKAQKAVDYIDDLVSKKAVKKTAAKKAV